MSKNKIKREKKKTGSIPGSHQMIHICFVIKCKCTAVSLRLSIVEKTSIEPVSSPLYIHIYFNSQYKQNPAGQIGKITI